MRITYYQCVSVALGIGHTKRIHCITIIVTCGLVRLYPIFPHYLTNGTILGKKLLNIKCALPFSQQILSESFLTLRRI